MTAKVQNNQSAAQAQPKPMERITADAVGRSANRIVESALKKATETRKEEKD